MNNNILIVSLIIIVLLLVVSVNMLNDQYSNKSKSKEGFVDVNAQEKNLNKYLARQKKNKDKSDEKDEQKEKFQMYGSMSRIDAENILGVPRGFDFSQYKLKTELDDSHIDLKDYVLKSSIPPAHKCPSCVCPKVSVLAGIGAEAACPPCPVQRCPKPVCPPPTKCPPQRVCPETYCPPQPAPQIIVSETCVDNDANADQNILDWARQGMEAKGDVEKNAFFQNIVALALGKHITSTDIGKIQETVDDDTKYKDINTMRPNQSVDRFTNPPTAYTADGRLI